MTIEQTMLVSDVITKWPQTVQIMEKFGFQCFGCGASQFETIEQGAQGHGMPPEQLEELMKELNEAAAGKEAPKKEGVDFTENAGKQISTLLEKSGAEEGTGLRIKVSPGGCAGLSYDFSFDKKNEGDKEFAAHDVKIYVDTESMEFLNGSKVDYVETLQKSGFTVDNPNATSTCGCGSSFG